VGGALEIAPGRAGRKGGGAARATGAAGADERAASGEVN